MRGLTTALTWLLGASAVIALVMAGTYASRRSLFERARDGDLVSAASARQADNSVEAAAGWGFILGIAVFVVLIVFLYRASKNTELWDTRSRTWAPGWTIGGWFVPIAAVLIPFLVACEISRRTPASPPGAARREGPLWQLGCWWGGWIAANLFYLASTGTSESLATLSRLDAQRTIAALCLSFASVMLIFAVRSLNSRQSGLRQSAPGWFAVGHEPSPMQRV